MEPFHYRHLLEWPAFTGYDRSIGRCRTAGNRSWNCVNSSCCPCNSRQCLVSLTAMYITILLDKDARVKEH